MIAWERSRFLCLDAGGATAPETLRQTRLSDQSNLERSAFEEALTEGDLEQYAFERNSQVPVADGALALVPGAKKA
jgi:hypothetical protein